MCQQLIYRPGTSSTVGSSTPMASRNCPFRVLAKVTSSNDAFADLYKCMQEMKASGQSDCWVEITCDGVYFHFPERGAAVDFICQCVARDVKITLPDWPESIAAITLAGLLLSSIGAHADGTWCAQYGGSNGGTNCGFYSFEQCEAARWGNGGFCYQNPFSQSQRRYRR